MQLQIQKTFFFIWGQFLFSFFIFVQAQEPSYHEIFDEIIGTTNSGVYYGTDYVEQYRVIGNKHKFFSKPNFISGSMVYFGQPYHNLDLKYDLFDQQLLVRHTGIIGSPVVKLIKTKIDNFTIDTHYFEYIHIDVSANSEAESGFYEVLQKNNFFTFLKKHKKGILRKSNEKTVYHEFFDKNVYFIKYKGDYYKIKKQKDISEIFQEHKRALKAIYNDYEHLKKSDQEEHFDLILKDLHKLLFQKSNRDI